MPNEKTGGFPRNRIEFSDSACDVVDWARENRIFKRNQKGCTADIFQDAVYEKVEGL